MNSSPLHSRNSSALFTIWWTDSLSISLIESFPWSTKETNIYTFLIINWSFNEEKYRRLFVLQLVVMRIGFETECQIREIIPLFVGCYYCWKVCSLFSDLQHYNPTPKKQPNFRSFYGFASTSPSSASGLSDSFNIIPKLNINLWWIWL